MTPADFAESIADEGAELIALPKQLRNLSWIDTLLQNLMNYIK